MTRRNLSRRLFLLAGLMLALVLGCSTALAANQVTTSQPENVQFHLYDYWVTSQDAEDTPQSADGVFAGPTYDHTNMKQGINKDHALLFIGNSGGMQYGWWNARTTGRLVKPYLVGGYPQLDLSVTNHTGLGDSNPVFNAGLKINVSSLSDEQKALGYAYEATPDGTAAYGSGATADESLEYLFKPEDGNGKKHFEAENLLMHDGSKGRYYFDSRTHFAEYAQSNQEFKVYDKAGAEGITYRFFPFNTQSAYVNSFDVSTNEFYKMNHYFGLMMEVEFYQPEDGKIKLANGDEEDMVFHFSGDDDVFVFVDNLLVGSVGGIHGRRAIDINFATGNVTESRSGENNKDSADRTHTTSIKEYYDMAKGEGYEYSGDLLNHEGYETELTDSGTLQDYTRHTLRMFYLERGNWDSNMEISFNLYYPYNDFVLQNTVVGGNQTLRDTDFTYDLEFDMDGVIQGLITEETTYAYEVYDASGEAAVQKGTVAIANGKITSVTKTEDNGNIYLDGNSRAYLSDGERVVLRLPDAVKVKAMQSYPAIPEGLSVNPWLLDTMTVTPSALKISDEKPAAEAKILAASDPTVVSYRNVIQTGDLKIIKTVQNLGENTPDADQSFTFAVSGINAISRVDGGTYPEETVTITVLQGEQTASAVIEDIVIGTSVTLTEITDGLADNSFFYQEGNGTYEIQTANETVEAAFTNLYAAAIPVSIAGTKTLDGGKPQAGQFSFVIASAAEGTLMPQETTVTNDAEGKFSFGPISYIKPGVHRYTIIEVWGDDPYIDYDTETEYDVTVTVTANTADNAIVLEAAAEIKKKANGAETQADVIEFKNFTRGGVQIKLRKLSSYDDRVLPGAVFALTHDPQECSVCRKEASALTTLSADEGLTEPTEGPTLDMENVTTQTATTDQYGTIIFRGLIEGHVYTLAETQAPQDYNLPEKNTWQIVNNGGTLMIDNAPVNGALSIHNRPTWWPVELKLSGLKTMQDKQPEEHEKFDFLVLDEKGNTIAQVQNRREKIEFPPIVIEKAGVYRFDVVERRGSDEKIWYDSSVYTATVSVEPAQGEKPGEEVLMITSITYERDGLPYGGKSFVFANRKAPKLPPTGDDSNLSLWLSLMGLTTAGALILTLCRRRKT